MSSEKRERKPGVVAQGAEREGLDQPRGGERQPLGCLEGRRDPQGTGRRGDAVAQGQDEPASTPHEGGKTSSLPWRRRAWRTPDTCYGRGRDGVRAWGAKALVVGKASVFSHAQLGRGDPPLARAKLDQHPKQELDASLADPVSAAVAHRGRRRRARSQVHALVALSQLSDAIARAPCPGRGEPGASSAGPLPIAGRHRART